VSIDNEHCGFILRCTHGLSCACKLAKYDSSIIPLNKVHVMWTRLSFSNMSSCDLSWCNSSFNCTWFILASFKIAWWCCCLKMRQWNHGVLDVWDGLRSVREWG